MLFILTYVVASGSSGPAYILLASYWALWWSKAPAVRLHRMLYRKWSKLFLSTRKAQGHVDHLTIKAMLQKLLKRAQTSFAAFHAGYPHDNTLTSRSKSDEPDELEILGGRKSVITSKSSSNSPASNPAASSDQQQPFSTDTQSGPHQYDEVPPSLLDYYNTLGHPRMGTQVSGDFDMTPSSFVAPASGYGYAQGMLGAVQPPFQQAYTSGHYLPQQGMYMQASIHQPQQLAPIDITMANERTQDDIWQDFMGHLGLTRPIDE